MEFWRQRGLKRVARTGAYCLLGFALALAALPFGQVSAQTTGVRPLDDQEQAFLTLINQYRAQSGAPALTATNTLNYSARVWSLTQAANNLMTHDVSTPSGTSTPYTRMQAANYPLMGSGSNSAGENVAFNSDPTAQTIFTQWKNSPEHNMNMVNSGFRAIGIARAQSGTGMWYWTTDFAGVVDTATPPVTPAAAMTIISPNSAQTTAVTTSPIYNTYNPYQTTNPYQTYNPYQTTSTLSPTYTNPSLIQNGTYPGYQTTTNNPYLTLNPYGQSTPYGQNTNPYALGSSPYGVGTNPYGVGTNPYGVGTSPYGVGTAANPYGGVISSANPYGSIGAVPQGVVTGVPGYPTQGIPTQGSVLGQGVPMQGGFVPSSAVAGVPGGSFDPTQGGVFGGAGLPGGQTMPVGAQGGQPMPMGVQGGLPYGGQPGPGSVQNTNPYANPNLAQGQMQLNPGSGGTAGPVTTNPNQPPAASIAAVADPSSAFSAGSKAASYNAPLRAAGTIFAPLVLANSGGWNSVLSVQNPSTNSSASYTITAYDGQGKAAATFGGTTPANGTTTYNLGSQLPAGFIGSIKVDGATPVVAIVNQDRAGSNGYVEPLVDAGAQALYAPLVFGSYNGWTSQIAVQNLDSQPAKVTVSYTAAGTGAVSSEQEVTIPGYSARVYNLGQSAAVPAGFNGSAVVHVTNGREIAAVVAAQHTNGLSQSYTALTGGSTSVAAPLLFKNRNGWSTGIQVQNVGTATANISVGYAASDGSGSFTETQVVQAGSVGTFYQPSSTVLPDGFTGSATITSDGSPVAVLVNAVNYTTNLATTYTSGGDSNAAATRVFAPLLFKGSAGINTGVQVQASGAQPATVTVTYYDANGQSVTTQQDTIPAGQSRTFYQPSVTGLPDGFKGSAVVSAGAGQSISAIVNQVRY